MLKNVNNAIINRLWIWKPESLHDSKYWNRKRESLLQKFERADSGDSINYLYATQNPITGLIKIGHSFDPEKRIHNLELQAGMDFKTLGICQILGEYKSYLIEQAYHAWLFKNRIKGEWHNIHPRFIRMLLSPIYAEKFYQSLKQSVIERCV